MRPIAYNQLFYLSNEVVLRLTNIKSGLPAVAAASKLFPLLTCRPDMSEDLNLLLSLGHQKEQDCHHKYFQGCL